MPNKTAIYSTYPWTQAVCNGLLIDVTETARGTGFNCPVAVTRAVWRRCVQAPEGAAEVLDEAGRLSNVLGTLIERVPSLAGPGDALHYPIRVRDDTGESRAVMKARLAFDDDGWPCLRVTLAEED